jgi:hypothetical protein
LRWIGKAKGFYRAGTSLWQESGTAALAGGQVGTSHLEQALSMTPTLATARSRTIQAGALTTIRGIFPLVPFASLVRV